MRSPLEQFRIKEILKLNIMDNNIILITDIGLYLIVGILILIIIEKEGRGLSIRKKLIIKEVRKDIIEKIIRTIVSGKEKYMIILKTLLMSILIYNIIGLVPYNKTITSELILTMTISISLLIGITLIGIEKNGIRILKILVPQNTPLILVPLLVLIETISYIARGLSLGLRLGANMIAGHTLLKIIITFIYSFINMDLNKHIGITWENKINTITNTENITTEEIKERIKNKETSIGINIGNILKWIITIIPITALILIIILEIGIGIMQALVFVIISGIYISDVETEIH